MKAASFELVRPTTVGEVVDCLTSIGPTARLLAGGQSLLPLMAARAAQPAVVVDLANVAGLDHITDDGASVTIGAMTRYCTIECSALVADRVPLLALAVPHITHATIRNQGTIGGSVANADPTAEIPVVAVASDAVMIVAGAAGVREVAAGDFFRGVGRTALSPGELLMAVRFPAVAARTTSVFAEHSRRPGDVALASVALSLTIGRDDRIVGACIALGSVAATPLRAHEAERMLLGQAPDPELFGAAAASAIADLQPNDDVLATGGYRRHLAGVLVRRALADAWSRRS
ncbi:MAG: molybdopterin dehydrogenase FAD-binding protein [Ilumatobacteraceae bacterium]|nr:molybdopterin dehydrogenase FAD-binding protein [Ilumatobacteraceae bacterium]